MTPAGLNNRATDRQAHAKAVGLGREERIEDLLDDFCVQPHAGIFDADDQLRILFPRTDEQFPGAFSGFRHRTHAIHHEVQHDLLQLNPVGFDFGQARDKAML